MKIDTLSDLEALLKLCHKQNVHTVIVDGLTVQLTPMNPDVDVKKNDPNAFIDTMTGQPMSDDEIMFWHAQNRGN